MENETVCPICKGEKFMKAREETISGFRYVFYRRCECLKKRKTEHKNPFQEGEKSNATDSTAL